MNGRRLTTMLTAAALGAGVAVGAVGCGDDGDESPAAESATESATEAAPTETEEQGGDSGAGSYGY